MPVVVDDEPRTLHSASSRHLLPTACAQTEGMELEHSLQPRRPPPFNRERTPQPSRPSEQPSIASASSQHRVPRRATGATRPAAARRAGGGGAPQQASAARIQRRSGPSRRQQPTTRPQATNHPQAPRRPQLLLPRRRQVWRRAPPTRVKGEGGSRPHAPCQRCGRSGRSGSRALAVGGTGPGRRWSAAAISAVAGESACLVARAADAPARAPTAAAAAAPAAVQPHPHPRPLPAAQQQ